MALTNEKPTTKKIVCDNCESEDAAADCRCNDCGIFLCQYCTEFHRRSRSTKHHELLTMEELKSNPAPQMLAEKIRCPKHKEEVIKLFCKTCQITICRDCTIVDHQGHKYGFVEELAVKEKQKILKNLNEVKQRKGRVVEGIEICKKFNEILEAKKKSTISEISLHFDELVKAVESRKNEMVGKASSLANAKQKQIHAQLEVLEVALASCDSSIEFTERAFKNGNDTQILSMEKHILQSLEQLKAVKDQTKPCVTEFMVFIIPPSVQETNKKLLKDYDIDVTVASPENCHASFKEEEKKFDAGKKYFIILICHDKDNRRLRYGGQDVKPSFTGIEVSDVAVTDNKDGSYIIGFCLRQGGMLKFAVSINGMPAPNCSLAKQVKWVISDVHGKGVITDGGRTMKGENRHGECCWRVGGCYFECGVHAWKVHLRNQFPNYYQARATVGIVDSDEINIDIARSQKKWVYSCSLFGGQNANISLTLDLEKRSVSITDQSSGTVNNYEFTARRVSPFFACYSPHMTLQILE